MEKKQEAVRRWLNDPENIAMLDSIAHKSYWILKKEGLLPAFLLDDASPDRDAVDVIRNELFLFLSEKDRFQNIIGITYQGIGTLLCRAFLNYCRDKNRGIDVSPWRFFRREAVSILRNSKELSSRKNDEGIVFSYGTEPYNGTTCLLGTEEAKEIPFTAECQQTFIPSRKDALYNPQSLHHTLCWFLSQAQVLKDCPGCWVLLNDFMTWFIANRSRNLPVQTDLMLLQDELKNQLVARLPDTANTPDQWYDPDVIAGWAKMCAAILTRQEQNLLFLHLVKNLNPRQIAEELKDTSRNTVANRIDEALFKLKSFLIDKRWVSYDDLNEDAFSFFMEMFNKELEIAISSP